MSNSFADAFKKASKNNQELAKIVEISEKESASRAKWERAEAEAKRKWVIADKRKEAEDKKNAK